MAKLLRLFQWLTERDRNDDARWYRFLWKSLGWLMAICFLLGTLVMPLWEDFDNLSLRKECEAKHQVKCERQWAPVRQ